jgi:hypothetical protein
MNVIHLTTRNKKLAAAQAEKPVCFSPDSASARSKTSVVVALRDFIALRARE